MYVLLSETLFKCTRPLIFLSSQLLLARMSPLHGKFAAMRQRHHGIGRPLLYCLVCWKSQKQVISKCGLDVLDVNSGCTADHGCNGVFSLPLWAAHMTVRWQHWLVLLACLTWMLLCSDSPPVPSFSSEKLQCIHQKNTTTALLVLFLVIFGHWWVDVKCPVYWLFALFLGDLLIRTLICSYYN
jgi:hypothetical protein